MLKNHHGFTLMETIAALVIISAVLSLAITVIISVQRASIANQAKIQAIEVANELRDDITTNFDYATVLSLTLGNEVTLTPTACTLDLVLCDLITTPSIDATFTDTIQLSFHKQADNEVTYRVIRFDITITYYGSRSITIGGYIYE